ncbi:MAG: hypothetical protein AB7N71_15290 [Phycisphaerae bacterium]
MALAANVEIEWDGPTIRELLGAVVALLESNDAQSWATYFQEARECLATSGERSIASILQTYGGMGSFNDLVLGCPENRLNEQNRRLDQLRRELYHRCRAVQQEFNRMDQP